MTDRFWTAFWATLILGNVSQYEWQKVGWMVMSVLMALAYIVSVWKELWALEGKR